MAKIFRFIIVLLVSFIYVGIVSAVCEQGTVNTQSFDNYEFHEEKQYSIESKEDLGSDYSIIKEVYEDDEGNEYVVHIYEFPDRTSFAKFIIDDIYESKKSYTEIREQPFRYVFDFAVLILDNDCGKIMTGVDNTLLVFEADTRYPSELLNSLSKKYPSHPMANTESFQVLINKAATEGLRLDYVSKGLLPADVDDYELFDMIVQKRGNFPVHHATYLDKDKDRYKVQLIDFNSGTYPTDELIPADELEGWASPKIHSGQPFSFENSTLYLYKSLVGPALIWTSGKTFVQVNLNGGNIEKKLPVELLRTFLKVYPSDCDTKGCVGAADSITEVCERLSWINIPSLGSLYYDYNGFSIKCKDRVMYGEAGKVVKPDLTYEEFKEKIKEYVSEHIPESILTSYYQDCMSQGTFEMDGQPLDGFYESCYNKVFSKLQNKIDQEDMIDYEGLRICESVKLTVEDDGEYINKQKMKFGDELVDGLIDCRIKEELGRKDRLMETCRNLKEGDEEMAECEVFNRHAEEEEITIHLEPCTEEVLREGRDCTSVKKDLEEQKATSEEVTKSGSVIEKSENIIENKEEKHESVFSRIFSFFRNFFS